MATNATPTIAKASPAVSTLLSRKDLMGTDFSPLMAHKNETVWFERYTGHRGGWPSIIVRAGSSDLCCSIPSKIEIDPANKADPLWFIATWTTPSALIPSTDSHET
jgi:hypothetical protein